MAQQLQHSQFEANRAPRDRFAGGQRGEGFVGQIEKFRMRIVRFGQIVEQLGDIVTGVQAQQVFARRPEAPQELRLGQ